MTANKEIFNNFAGGLVGQEIKHRVDLQRVINGSEVFENLIPLIQGGCTYRTGTIYQTGTKFSNLETDLTDFQPTSELSYIIERGSYYFRFHNETGYLGTEISTPYSEDDVANIVSDSILDRQFLTHGFYAPRQLIRLTDTTFELSKIDFIDGPYNVSNEVGSLSATSSSGVMTLTSTEDVWASTDTSGTGGTGDFDRHVRIQDRGTPINITGITQDNPAVITLDSMPFEDGQLIYLKDVVGMVELNGREFNVDEIVGNTFKLKNSNGEGIDTTNYTAYTSGGTVQRKFLDWYYGKITGFTSATQVELTLVDGTALSSLGPFDTFKLGSFSSTTSFPETIRFHNDRAYFGSNGRVDFSTTGIYNDFTPEVFDDSAGSIVLATKRESDLYWMNVIDDVRIGTSEGIFALRKDSISQPFSPTNVEAPLLQRVGLKDTTALTVADSIICVQQYGRKLYEVVTSSATEGLAKVNLTAANPQLFKSPIKQMVYVEEPFNLIWFITEDGGLKSLSYDRDEDVVAFAEHSLGGSAIVKSIATIRGENEDKLFAIVQREIDGNTVQYIEKLSDRFIDKTIYETNFLDCSFKHTPETPASGLTLSALEGEVTVSAENPVFTSGDVGRVIRASTGKAEITSFQTTTQVTLQILTPFSGTSLASGDWTISTNTVTGLGHLEGETIQAVTDGGVHPDVTVLSGSVTLEDQFTHIILGYSYTAKLRPITPVGNTQQGGSIAQKNRLRDVFLFFKDTVGVSTGRDESSLQEVDFRVPSDPLNEGVPLFTGRKRINPKMGWGDEGSVYIEHSQPLPFTLLAMMIHREVSDK